MKFTKYLFIFRLFSGVASAQELQGKFHDWNVFKVVPNVLFGTHKTINLFHVRFFLYLANHTRIYLL